MAAAAPPQLSGLADLLLRRPPSLRELVTLVGYADDYAWFAGLARRLFPQEAEAALSAPDVRTRVVRFAQLFGERHFPLYAPFFEFFMDEGDEPPWTWLRRGIPFELMGFGYDGLHEMWDGYREGLSALVLLAKPPDSFYEEPDGLRVAWLESAAERIPQETLLRIPKGGIPLDDLAEALKGTGFEGAAQTCAWVFAETGNFFLDASYDDGMYEGFDDPWEDEVIEAGAEEWRKAAALMDAVGRLTDWLEEDLPAISPRCWTSSWSGSPITNKNRRTTTMTDAVDTTQWSLPGPADMPRDTLKAQLEVYGETILLRGFEEDSTWVRTVSADAIANVFTQHLGFSSGLLPQETLWWNQGETGQVVALWRPPQVWSVALQREAFRPPARLRLPMPGLVFVCSPGRAPWVYAATGRPADPEQHLFRAPAFNVFRDGRVCPGSHRFPEEVGLIPESFFQSYFSLTGDTRDRSKKHPDNLQALWEEIDGTTAYPAEDLVPQCTVAQAMVVSEGRRGYR